MTLNRRFSVSPKVWFAAFGLALLLALGWVATQSGPLPPIQVTVMPVERGDVSPALFGIDTVEAYRRLPSRQPPMEALDVAHRALPNRPPVIPQHRSTANGAWP